jgi:hypothetical protein
MRRPEQAPRTRFERAASPFSAARSYQLSYLGIDAPGSDRTHGILGVDEALLPLIYRRIKG